MKMIQGEESMPYTQKIKVFSPLFQLVERLRGEIISFKEGQGV